MTARCRAAAVLLAVVALAGCGAPPAPAAAPVPASAAPTTAAPTTAVVTAPAGTPAPTAPEDGVARCTAADLALTLGEPRREGQRTVALVYTNTSSRPCGAWGVPGVDLVGPPDPNGETYQVRRPGAGDSRPRATLQPGASATAVLTYLTDSPGSFGTSGSSGWVPTRLVTTPPGDTAQLTAPWTSGDTVLRQDGATRPGTFVGPLTVGP